MENQDNISELEAMRIQMAEFKRQLEQQEIVNDRLITESMKKKMSWIKNYIIFEAAVLPILFILWIGLKEYMNLSWWNVGFLIVLCCIDVYMDYYINIHSLKDDDYMHNNLIATVKKLLRMKRQRALQMVISVPMVVAWLLWAGIEAYVGLPLAEGDFQNGFIIGGLIGGVIGGIIGLVVAIKIYHKMQNTNDEVINQIKDITGEE